MHFPALTAEIKKNEIMGLTATINMLHVSTYKTLHGKGC
jgi:hypothetical protein